MRESKVEQQAIHWFAVMQSDARTEQDVERFQAWIEADPVHASAYRELEQVWRLAENFSSKPEVRKMRRAVLRRAAARYRRNSIARIKRWLPYAMAASLVAAVSLFYFSPKFEDSNSQDRHVYETRTGEQRAVNLSDGSSIVLDTQTRLVSDLNDKQRQIFLYSGQARFDVAKDSERPFSVIAGHGKVTALGTVFVVRKNRDEILVSLLQGEVEVVQKKQLPGTESSSEKPRRVRETRKLKAGEQVAYSNAGISKAVKLNREKVTAWQQGRLVFDDATLEEVVNDLNRYADSKILFGDDSLKDIRVTGVFKSGDNERAVKVFKAYFSLASTRDQQGNLLLISEVPEPVEP